MVLAMLLGTAHGADAPVGNEHAMSKGYVPPKDPAVQKKLEWWQDLKFGLMMHWGTYSQWGIVESWSICPEDEGWCQRRGPAGTNYFAYVTAYEGLRQTFNRRVLERHLDKISLRFAIPDHPWVDTHEGAAVRIAMTVAVKSESPGQLLAVQEEEFQIQISIKMQ